MRPGDLVDALGPTGPLVDPQAKGFDLLGGQSIALGRHHRFGILRADPLEQIALAALAGNDDRPGVAARERVFAAVETEPGVALVGLCR